MLLRDAFKMWISGKTIHIKPSTLRCYQRLARTAEAIFGNLPIDQIKSPQINLLIETRRGQGAKDTSINCDLRYLKAFLRYCKNDLEILEKVPSIKMLRCPRRRAVQPLTPDEFRRLLKEAEKYPKVRVLLLIIGSTGMRLSEALHLQWTDIDFFNGQISICEKDNWRPKNHQNRIVPLSLELAAELKSWKFKAHSSWVLGTRDGKLLTLRNVSRDVRKVFVAAELYSQYRGAHLLRHTFASRAALSGDLESLRSVLGHESLSTTALYLHSSTQSRRNVVQIGSLMSE